MFAFTLVIIPPTSNSWHVVKKNIGPTELCIILFKFALTLADNFENMSLLCLKIILFNRVVYVIKHDRKSYLIPKLAMLTFSVHYAPLNSY